MLEAGEVVYPNGREYFFRDLKKQINEAYNNRVIQTIKITSGGISSMEREEAEIKKNRQIKEFSIDRGIPIEDIILTGDTQHSQGAVYVSSFDDFRELLKFTFRKLVKEGMFHKLDNAREKILRCEQHEREHYEKAGRYNIPARLGIQFVENKINGKVGFCAFVDLIGDFGVEQYRDIAVAPRRPSEIDKIVGQI